MLVTAPLFGKDVAPRFMVATDFAFAHIKGGKVGEFSIVTIGTENWHSRMLALKDLGVDVLFCGGFNRQFEPLAESLGIKIITGLTGNVNAIFDAYAAGFPLPFSCGFPMNKRQK